MATSALEAPNNGSYHKDFENKASVCVGWGGIHNVLYFLLIFSVNLKPNKPI